jgi:hypothetical protein
MKIGDKVWVQAEVIDIEGSSVRVQGPLCSGAFWVVRRDCKPVEPEAVEKQSLTTESDLVEKDDLIPFKVGDPVVSWNGRKGIVEALNEIEGFPITVRHSMREQVFYKLGGVKHDETTQASDPVNPSHYKQESIECIEAIKAALRGGFTPWLWGNILKYTWRWPNKNGIEDLKKARWYLDRLIQEEEVK